MVPEKDAQKAVTKRLFRLAHILKVFIEKEHVSTNVLCQVFGTTPRTIQRDLKALRESGFPIHEESRGSHRLDKSLLKNLDVYDEAELALIVALKDLVTHLGRPFEKAADSIFNRLCDYTDCRPVFVKIDEPVLLSRRLMDKIIKAIQSSRCVAFPYKDHAVVTEPYRIAYFDGIWYLVARDTHDNIIKKYALDKITDLKIMRTSFKSIPKDLDEILERSVNIWFSGNRGMEVVIEVDAAWAEYFKRRHILPLQEIIENREDGSMLVRFMACSLEEVAVCLKPWLPHIRILKPETAKERFLADFKEWIAWQGKNQ